MSAAAHARACVAVAPRAAYSANRPIAVAAARHAATAGAAAAGRVPVLTGPAGWSRTGCRSVRCRCRG